MAPIEVNHSVLREVAQAVEDYCGAQDREMRRADEDVKAMLSSDWLGADARDFGGRWEGVDGSGSTAVKLRDSWQRFGEGLTACANEYAAAQAEVYNAASRLPKFLYW